MIYNSRQNIGRGTIFILVALTIGLWYAIHNVSTLMSIKQREGLDHIELVQQSDPLINHPRKPKPSMKFHVVVTATDSTYSKWQCRIMYYWYKKVKDLPGSDMGGFTRVLHSGQLDNLVQEIPTFVAKPLPNGMDQGYIVLNRPYAFVQWLETATIKEEYILMGEPDHIFVKPLPNLATGKNPVAYPFFYINPQENEKIVRKFYPEGSISNVDPIGSSPVIIRKSLLKEVAPIWMDISLRIKNDPEADSTLDWVQEMYAYAIASALNGVKHNLEEHFMVQPPREVELNSYIIHYTYPCDYNNQGELTFGQITDWHFDKRTYQEAPPPKNITLPPSGAPETVVKLIEMINEATANLPDWESL